MPSLIRYTEPNRSLDNAQSEISHLSQSVVGSGSKGDEPAVQLIESPQHGEQNALAALLFSSSGGSFTEYISAVEKMSPEERKELLENKLERLGDVQVFDDFPRWYEANSPRFWKDADFDTKPIFHGVKPNYDVLRHLFGNVFGGFDSTSYLTEITCPVLLMMGKYDFSNPPSLWDNYWDKFPDCTYHLLEDSGHNPMTEIPEKFDKLLIDWIKTH